MGKVNASRVVLGGIVAGLIVNVSEYLLHDVVLKAQHEEAMKSLGKSMPAGGSVLTVWILYGFAWAIAAVWLYAAIRPRYGAGPGTAARAALAVWFFAALLPAITMWNLALMPLSPLELGWDLVTNIVAVLAGAALYKEGVA